LPRPSDKVELDKKTILILETLGTILLFACILGIENFTRSIFMGTVGICLMVLPLINRSDDDQRTKTLEKKPLTKNQSRSMLIFSIITFGVIVYFAFLDEWLVVLVISFLVGDFALIFLIGVVEDYRDKRKMIKPPRSLCLPKPTNKSAIR